MFLVLTLYRNISSQSSSEDRDSPLVRGPSCRCFMLIRMDITKAETILFRNSAATIYCQCLYEYTNHTLCIIYPRNSHLEPSYPDEISRNYGNNAHGLLQSQFSCTFSRVGTLNDIKLDFSSYHMNKVHTNYSKMIHGYGPMP